MSGEGLVASQPDSVGAMLALLAASDMLESAGLRLGNGDYEAALIDARDSMRLASSAVLLQDGYVATTLEATVSYLEWRYAGLLPLGPWLQMETAFPGRSAGLMSRLASLLGKNKKPDKDNTGQVLATAGSFISSVRAILGVR